MELDNRRVGLKRKLVDRSKLKYGRIKKKKKKTSNDENNNNNIESNLSCEASQ